MSIPKVVGIEQEYAIKIANAADLSVFHASCALINAYARHAGLRESDMNMIFDYGHETPFRDIRGNLFKKATGEIIMSREENRKINTMLANGSRLYTDHAHPEYSTPECTDALSAIACDKAGEIILRLALKLIHKNIDPTRITLFKNNTDHQGHSYGCHENYLMAALPHERVFKKNPEIAIRVLVPFLVTRQIFAGAGKVGSERGDGPRTGYQISQRAEFMENLFGLETMYARPIINTREEHHADPDRYRRLHLILGDANMCEFAAFLKIGATQLVLGMLEDDFIGHDLTLKDPIKAIRAISENINAPVELEDGQKTSALDIQKRFLEWAQKYVEKVNEEAVPDAGHILECWQEALEGLNRLRLSDKFDILDDPGELTGKLDWMLKLWLINRIRNGKNLPWNDPQLRILDLKYHNIEKEESIFYNLQERGMVERLLDDEDIEHFVGNPPEDTRAWFRGKCIEKFPTEMHLVNWEVVGFDHGEVHRMIPLLNPLKGGRESFESVFENCRTAMDLIAAVSG